jgi:crossover junction endodeoxyribonuclease RuvC
LADKIRIFGIDPGSRITGYGVIDTDGFRHSHVASGHIVIKGDALSDRLGIIFSRLTELIASWQPDAMAIEQVFVNRNIDSALKLGHARGAAICAAVNAGLPVGEYSPRAIKKAVTGQGAADKAQIQQMMQILLKLEDMPQSDEADALAISVCHANHMHVRSTGVASGVRRGRWV